jgi:hypothetical protein
VTDADDKTWLEVLAGRTPADPSQPVAREALALRESISRRRQAQHPDLPAHDPQREAELLARAQREGLIDPSRLHRRPRWLGSASRPAVTLAYAAAIALLSVGLFLFLRTGHEPEVVRGTHDGIVTIEARDPVALQERLVRELRAAGISATGYERLGFQGVDADLPRPIPQSVREVLEKHHVPIPGDGSLRVEITFPEKR